MKETLYLKRDLAIINFAAEYANSEEQLLKSATFSNFVHNYIDYLKEANEELYYYVVAGHTAREATVEILRLFRMMRVFKMDEIESIYLNDKGRLLEFIEEMYNFWKRHQRFLVLKAGGTAQLQQSNFVQADSNFNKLIRNIYRSISETLMERNNRVYRQLQAGTNAALLLANVNVKLSDKYAALKNIDMVTSVMLRTPMILHPRSNKRTGMFTETDVNPITYFKGSSDDFFCYPIKI